MESESWEIKKLRYLKKCTQERVNANLGNLSEWIEFNNFCKKIGFDYNSASVEQYDEAIKRALESKKK